ncbi:MAG: GNAT family N-acetyltransferase [Trueperella sp.]|nr:GNAT family N-acetyltransferase [Trueperella sp.]
MSKNHITDPSEAPGFSTHRSAATSDPSTAQHISANVQLIPLPRPTSSTTGAQYIGPAWQRMYDLSRTHQIETNGHADYLSPTVSKYREDSLKPPNPEFPVYKFAVALLPDLAPPTDSSDPHPSESVLFDDLTAEAVVGTASAVLPQKENTYTSHINVFVDPERRRHRIGTAALAKLRAFLRTHDRTQAETWPTTSATSANDGSQRVTPRLGVGTLAADHPTVHFLRANGFGLEMVEKASQLNLDTFKGRLVSGAITQPKADQNLEIVTYKNEIVHNITAEFIAAINAFNADHPQSDSATPYTTTAEQYTQSLHDSIDRGFEHRGVFIRERKSGRIVATTEVYFRSASRVAAQADTWVHAEYRGRGLATLAKIELYRELLVRDPRLTRVATENAESNVGMWKVNERLGFEIVAANSHWVSVFNDDEWGPFVVAD